MAIVIPIYANPKGVLCVLSRRAFACANVHDMFNWLSAFILLITEVLTGRLPERRKNGQTTDPTRMSVTTLQGTDDKLGQTPRTHLKQYNR